MPKKTETKIKNFPAQIKESSFYNFEIKESGLCLIEIIASCKSWRQNWRCGFNDDDLAVKIDDIEFPKSNGKNGLINGEAAWNGNNLKGTKKIGIFVFKLEAGNHKINFLPNKNPLVYSIDIKKIKSNIIEYIPEEENKQAEDGNNRQWITIALNNLSLKNLYINAKAGGETGDRDDIKLIIDGEIQKNPSNKSPKYKNWHWAGNLLAGQSLTFEKDLNLSKNFHYIELWADKTPILEKIKIVLEENKKEAEEDQEILEEVQEPQKRIPTVDNPEWTGDFNDDTEQMILARAIFGEARNTLLSDEARFAVGWTIRNRVEMQTWWGKNYYEVILKPGHYSCFTKTDKNYKLVIDPLSAKSIVDKKSWPKCYEIAGKILNNEISDPVNGATCYHDISISQERFTTKDVPGAKFIKKIDRLMFYYSPN